MKKILFLFGLFGRFGFVFAIENFIGRTDFHFIENNIDKKNILVNPLFNQNIPFTVTIKNSFTDTLNIKFGAVDGMWTKGTIVKEACKENNDVNQFSDYVSFDTSGYFILSGGTHITTSGTFNFPTTMSGIKFGCIVYFPFYSGADDQVQATSRKAIIVNLIHSDLWIIQSMTGDFISGGLVTFSILFGNNGDFTANNVGITSILTGFEIISSEPTYDTINGNQLNRNGFSLTSGQVQTLIFTAMITQDLGVSTNFMQIGFTGYDPFPENSSSFTGIDLGLMVDIHINHSYGKTMSGDFIFYVRNGYTRNQIYNSIKNSNQPRINIDQNGNGQVPLNLPPSGDEYLVVFKGDGNLSVGYTGTYTNQLTGFDFQDFINHPNLYPFLVYNNKNYLIGGDIELGNGTFDMINDIDFNTITENLTLGNNLLIDLYDFDINQTINAIEQAIIIGNLHKKGFMYQIDTPGTPYFNYKGLVSNNFK